MEPTHPPMPPGTGDTGTVCSGITVPRRVNGSSVGLLASKLAVTFWKAFFNRFKSLGMAIFTVDRRETSQGVRFSMAEYTQKPMQPKLAVELVPRSTWEWNVRSELTRTQWDKLRAQIYQKADHKCEVCGGRGKKHPLEAHERWSYDDNTHVQTLVGIEALCPLCHMVRHMGRTISLGLGDVAMAHMDKVNGWTPQQTEDHVTEAFKVWGERSKYNWHLDLTWLKNVGF